MLNFLISSTTDVLPIAVLLAALGLLFVMAYPRRTSSRTEKNLFGKVAIVTGANSGIGLQIAKQLALRGCRVILACRNADKAGEARDYIIKSTGNCQVQVQQLDLDDFESVRSFARTVLSTENQLDLLINNAATLHFESQPMSVDENGLDTLLRTNYYGPFLLTNLLLPLLIRAAPSRIVFLSSIMIMLGELDEDILRGSRPLSGAKAYGVSKLAGVGFARLLSQRLEGRGVFANCVHPGNIKSNIVRNLNVFLRFGYAIFSPLFTQSASKGAEPVLYLATDDEMEGVSGKYFDKFKVKDVDISNQSVTLEKLWEISSEITGLSDELIRY